MVKALNQLRKDNKGRLKGLVLDLRNNPGGVLQSAVEVADAFLTKGLIVYTRAASPTPSCASAPTRPIPATRFRWWC